MKSFAKINIFLKITGTRENYHEIASRFVLCDEIYDELNFIKNDFKNEFNIVSNIKIPKINTITKAYNELKNLGFKNELEEFFKKHALSLIKKIPIGGGLGGGSSNAATFLKMTNNELNLKIPVSKLMQISKNIGADVAFFTSGYKSANVSGIGEIIEEFDDFVPHFKIVKKNIFCDTGSVYKEFRKNFINSIDKEFSIKLLNMNSNEILSNFKNYELNDLMMPCLNIYPDLLIKENEFLSGSGSSCFTVEKK